jgi:hypothetical protein
MLAERNIYLRFAEKGRHTQLAFVDSYIGIIVKALIGMNTYIEQQVDTTTRRTSYWQWNRFLQTIVNHINQHTVPDRDMSEMIHQEPIIPAKLIPINTVVRVPLLAPYDPIYGKHYAAFERGRFRKGDYRYIPRDRHVVIDILLIPGQYPRYVTGKIVGDQVIPNRNISYAPEELQIVQ